LCGTGAFAESVHNFNQWFGYWGDHQLGTSKWGAHFDAHLRRANTFSLRQQYVLRPGVNYQVRENVQLQSAWMWIPAYPYGDAPARAQVERRWWQQVTATHETRRVQWSHRFRWESRWTAPRGGGATVFEQRARYAWRATVPGRRGWAYSFGEELLFPTPPETHPAVMDQHRLQVTLSKQVTPVLRVDWFYLHQLIWQRNGRTRETNHTLGVAFFHTSSLRQLRNWLR